MILLGDILKDMGLVVGPPPPRETPPRPPADDVADGSRRVLAAIEEAEKRGHGDDHG